MIDFPTSPAIGDVVTSPDGLSWVWDGTTWLLVAEEGGGGDGGSGFTYSQDTPPTATAPGQTWFNTSTGYSYAWVDDGTSQQWVQFAPGVGGTSEGGGSSTPAGPANGVSLGHSLSQNIPSGLQTVVTFDSVYYDSAGYHDAPDRITIPAGQDGRYLVGYTSSFFPLAGGTQRVGFIIKNGYAADRTAISLGFGSASYPGQLGGMATLDLVAGDYIQHLVFQDSGVEAPLQGNNSAYHLLEFFALKVSEGGGGGGSGGGGDGVGTPRGQLAYAQSTTNVNVATDAWVDVGLSVTWEADPTRTYRTSVYLLASSTVGNDDLSVEISDGAGGRKQLLASPYLDPQTSVSVMGAVVETGLSGPVTRVVRATRAGTGTITVAGDPTYPRHILVEDITYDDGTVSGVGGGSSSGGSSTIEVGTKVGVISSFSGDVIPADSLICDGQVVPAGAEYDALRAIVGTNVPDLRDRFLLGAGLSYGIRTVGGEATHALVVGEMPSHTHVQDAHNHLQDVHIHDSVYNTAANPAAPNGVYPGYGSSADAGWRPSQLVGVAATNIASTATNQYAGGGGAHNNMPPWYAVVYIIQAKPTMATVSGGSGGGGGSGFTFVQDTKPVATKQGDTWLSTASTAAGGTSYVAIDNGTGALNWVQFAPGSGASAVSESGSNANGHWVKFGDGTMQCWHRWTVPSVSLTAYGTVFITAVPWTFPQPFVTNPVTAVAGCQVSTGASWGQAYNDGAASTTIRIFDAYGQTGPAYMAASAIGRWF